MTTIRARILDAMAEPRLRLLPVAAVAALSALGWLLDPLLGPVVPEGTQQSIIWGYVIVLVASMLISYALAPKPAQPPKPTLEDFDLPTAEEGRPIPVVFGTVWVSGPNILWYGDLDTEAIRVKGGKK